MIYRTFPRLPALVAKNEFEQIRSLTHIERIERSSALHKSAYFSPGSAISQKELIALRDQIRSELSGLIGSDKTADKTEFDRRLGEILLDTPLSPYEAGFKEVWNFFGLVLLPEISPWRFPKLTSDRFIGPPLRNAIGRTWWRSYILGADYGSDEYDAEPLGENEVYALLEKTTIGLNIELARAIVAAIYRKQRMALARDVFVEEFTKLMIREVPTVDFLSLGPDLERVLDEVADEAFASAKLLKNKYKSINEEE
jgi:hypothetical protein